MREPTSRRILRSVPPQRHALLKRLLLWGILVAGAAMVVVVLAAAAARSEAEAKVAAAQAQNAALQRTINQTTNAIATAKSDDEIERAARRWGYVRGGEQTIIIVTGSTK